MARYLLAALLVLQAATATAQNDASARFAQLQSLAGTWVGTGPNNLQLSVTYEIVSGGKAVMETRRPVGEPDMVTLFYLDGDVLMLTHFCSDGNQPRMRASDAEHDQLLFEFVDVTNLSDPHDGHMRGLLYIFDDADHLTQTWTWRQDGQEFPAAFALTRTE